MLGNPDTSNDPLATNIRRCGKCGQSQVRCYHVTRHYYRGIPSGRSYMYRCGGCGVEFQTLSPWRMITQALFALLMVPTGGLMALASLGNLSSTWWMAILGLLIVSLGAWTGWTAVRSVIHETKNPRA